MPYVNHRWLGGLLTNWRTISNRLERMEDLRRLRDEGQLELLPSKERLSMLAELEKLETNLGGVADMKDVPDVVFLVDLKKEQLAVREAKRLKIPVVALVDTNCDPDDADFIIPGNDDAISACSLITRAIADGVEAGKLVLTERELVAAAERQAAAEAAAKAKAEADRAAAEAAAKEAEAAAAAAAEAPAEAPVEAATSSEGESQ
jgi:small subunit ribosomal protein S2